MHTAILHGIRYERAIELYSIYSIHGKFSGESLPSRIGGDNVNLGKGESVLQDVAWPEARLPGYEKVTNIR